MRTNWSSKPETSAGWFCPAEHIPGPLLVRSTSRTLPDPRVEWIVLVLAGVLEAVWATALSASNNFRRLKPTLLFAVSLALSMAGLAYAMTGIPVGTAYAVWVGIGAVLTVAYAMAFGTEKATLIKVLLLMGIIGCVVGLKVVG